MRIEFWEPAGTVSIPGKGECEQIYARHAFDGCAGQEVPFRDRPGGREIGRATVVSVAVDDDGRGATWTVDITGDAERAFAGLTSGPMSFAPGGEVQDAVPRDPLHPRPPRIR